MYLAGYGNRNGPAEGKIHDLWVKVLAFEAADGNRGAIVTSDLCGVSRATYGRICAELKKRCCLDQSQVLLTYSHTHTGPALDECLQDYCNWGDAARARIRAYTFQLEATIVDKVAEALGRLAPATLWAGEGATGFAVNRRNNTEAEVSKILARGEKPKGPVDHTIPVLAVKSREGRLTGVLFGYACHTTTLSLYRRSGDFAGFAMIELQRAHPGSQAMFFQGCGADQNPIPRHTVELCEKYGKMLAKGVEETLGKRMRPLAPTLRWSRDLEERIDAAVEHVVAAVALDRKGSKDHFPAPLPASASRRRSLRTAS